MAKVLGTESCRDISEELSRKKDSIRSWLFQGVNPRSTGGSGRGWDAIENGVAANSLRLSHHGTHLPVPAPLSQTELPITPPDLRRRGLFPEWPVSPAASNTHPVLWAPLSSPLLGTFTSGISCT